MPLNRREIDTLQSLLLIAMEQKIAALEARKASDKTWGALQDLLKSLENDAVCINGGGNCPACVGTGWVKE